jgi:putative phosphoesterase
MPRFGRELPAELVDGLRDVMLILHAGDITQPFVLGLLGEIAPVEAVAGNNDPPELVAWLGRRKVIEAGGRRIGLTHGDQGKGQTTPQRALSVFADEHLDLIVFGHSHLPLLERRGDTWLVNPGSPTDKRRQPKYTYALIDVAAGELHPRLVSFPGR